MGSDRESIGLDRDMSAWRQARGDLEMVRETSFRARTACLSSVPRGEGTESVGRILLSMPVEDHADVAIRKFAGASHFTQVKILFWSSCMWLSLQSFSFSSTPTSRCMLQILRLNGSFAIAALFLESAFGVASIESDAENCMVNTIWDRVGRAIAICTMSMLIGSVPCLGMAFVGNKSFVYDEAWDDAKRRRMLRWWWTKVAIVWMVAVPYNLFCMVYLAAFLSAVGHNGNVEWSLTAVFYIILLLSLDVLILPLCTVVPLLLFLRSASLAAVLGNGGEHEPADACQDALANSQATSADSVNALTDSVGMTQQDYCTVVISGSDTLRGAAELGAQEEAKEGRNSHGLVGTWNAPTPRGDLGRRTLLDEEASEGLPADDYDECDEGDEEAVLGEVVPTPRPPAHAEAGNTDSTSDGTGDWYFSGEAIDSEEDVANNSKSWLITWF